MHKFVLSTLSAALLLSGCATVKGLGKDIQSVGEAGQKVVDAPKKK
jgi:predicted small secreted protein